MTQRRNDRRRAGRHNAAQALPPEAEPRRDDARERTKDEAPAGGPRPAGRGPLEGGFDPGLADLGDDVARGAEEGGSPAAPLRGRLEGGIDAGLTDLGDDVARGAEEGGSPAAPERGRLEGGIDAALTDLGDDADRPVVLDDDDR